MPASRSVGHGACRADSPAGERMDSPAAGRGPDSAAVFEAVEYGRISNLLFHPRYRSLDRRPSRDRHRHTRAVSRNAVRYKSLVRGEKGPRVVAANAATAEGGGRDKDGAAAARASRFRRHSRRRRPVRQAFALVLGWPRRAGLAAAAAAALHAARESAAPPT